MSGKYKQTKQHEGVQWQYIEGGKCSPALLNTEEEESSVLHSLQEAIKKISGWIEKHKLNIIGLYGEMGSGKTYFVKSFLKERGINPLLISSPTYTIAGTYPGNILHIDCYRINLKEFVNAGFPELIAASRLTFLEWAEKIEDYLMKIPHIKVRIKYNAEEQARGYILELYFPS